MNNHDANPTIDSPLTLGQELDLLSRRTRSGESDGKEALMDLQWQRQTELWLQLMGTKGKAALNIVLPLANETLYLEQSQGRARVSLCHPLPLLNQQAKQEVLLQLLSLLQPDAGVGIPLRAWLSGSALWLSALAPLESGAEDWAELVRRQRLLLDRVAPRIEV